MRLISAEWLRKLCSASEGGDEDASSLGAPTRSCSSSESSHSSPAASPASSPVLGHSGPPYWEGSESDSESGSIRSCCSYSSWGSLPAPEPLAPPAPFLPALSLLLSHRLAAEPDREPELILAELPADAATARLLSEARLLRAAAPPPPSSIAPQAEATAATVLSLPTARKSKPFCVGHLVGTLGRAVRARPIMALLLSLALISLAMLSAPSLVVDQLHSHATPEGGLCRSASRSEWRRGRCIEAKQGGAAARLMRSVRQIRSLWPRIKQQQPKREGPSGAQEC